MSTVQGKLKLLDQTRNFLALSKLKSCNYVTEDDLQNSYIPIKTHNMLKFGRNGNEVNVIINHPAISGVHFAMWCILFDEDSFPMCYIKDISLNGSKINGIQLQKDTSYLLRHNDIITIDDMTGSICAFQFIEPIEVKTDDTIFQKLNINQQVNKWCISNRIVGNGTFGHVLICKDETKKPNQTRKLKSKDYAVKIIKMKADRINKEGRILLLLNHPNIIKVYYTSMDLNNNLYIFQDLATGGDLFSYLAKTDCLTAIPETEALLIVYQILLALKYLHSRGIVHRDLKLDNILLESPEPCTRITIADFGIAKNLTSTNGRMHTVVGTPEYCAPEVGFKANREMYHHFSRAATLKDPDKGYNNKCDLWSLGVITHIMLTGVSPFYRDGTEKSIIESAMRGNINYNIRHWEKISSSAKDFVDHLLKVDVRKRFDSKKSLDHLWLKKHRTQLDEIYIKRILQGNSPNDSLSGMKTAKNSADHENRVSSEHNWKRKKPKTMVISSKKVKLNTLTSYAKKQPI
ncbi:Meiosis-specific serine/threonine-protein kinase mek1 [Maudiozyma exigua]|uniref:Meiosis-specific serine/threonine-protein kinase mek1 n=1 Tax=Maudiozyma exigua TaxID=34358 RepID=A0A9P7BDK6_MAUEX|nr:Meiosis-specific serine/threonine-protein kinase mek1 [Kazachstania exigua]